MQVSAISAVTSNRSDAINFGKGKAATVAGIATTAIAGLTGHAQAAEKATLAPVPFYEPLSVIEAKVAKMPYETNDTKVFKNWTEDVNTSLKTKMLKPLQQRYSYYTDPKFVQYKEHYVADDGKGYTMVWHYSNKDRDPNGKIVNGLYFVPDDYVPAGKFVTSRGYEREMSMPFRADGIRQIVDDSGEMRFIFTGSYNEVEKPRWGGEYGLVVEAEHMPPDDIALKALSMILNEGEDHLGNKIPFKYEDDACILKRIDLAGY